jgi:hypothetical protein
MGFTIYYRSTRPVSPAAEVALRTATTTANAGFTWLSCEPVHFFRESEDGHLTGGSKPNFLPHPDDVASAQRSGRPDGTVRTLLDILCQLSRDHGIDWEFRHDYSDGPIGTIRAGECVGDVAAQIDAIADLANMLAGDPDALDDADLA